LRVSGRRSWWPSWTTRRPWSATASTSWPRPPRSCRKPVRLKRKAHRRRASRFPRRPTSEPARGGSGGSGAGRLVDLLCLGEGVLGNPTGEGRRHVDEVLAAGGLAERVDELAQGVAQPAQAGGREDQ